MNAETAPQSVHSSLCEGNCDRFVWSSTSYLQCSKPAATIADAESENLTYCTVASHTLAISHVRNHGQGGRPESGINECLHRQYCQLARHFGYKAYWIDSACIPSQNQLRCQAIENINEIFASARVTVVINADI
jgi:hypothetical protein